MCGISGIIKNYINEKDINDVMKMNQILSHRGPDFTNIEKDKKSVALNVTIQSSQKTLEESDLEKINKLIISTVETKSGAKIRS